MNPDFAAAAERIAVALWMLHTPYASARPTPLDRALDDLIPAVRRLAQAQPAGDEPLRCGLAAHGGGCNEPMAEGADRCVFHLVEQVRRLQTYSQWASEHVDRLENGDPS